MGDPKGIAKYFPVLSCYSYSAAMEPMETTKPYPMDTEQVGRGMMSPLKTFTCFIIVLVSGAAFAQVDGYTCVNEYLDCGDITESDLMTVELGNIVGRPGDTVWLPVSLSAPADTVEAFIILIRWDSTYLQPLISIPGDVFLQFGLVGEFASVADDFFIRLSQNPADSGAIAAFFNLGGPGPFPVLPPGDHGVIFRLPFVVDPAIPPGATAEFGFSAVNEFVVLSEPDLEAFCADCRRTNMAVMYDCVVEINDTVSVDPLVIDTLLDTVSCSAAVYPTTIGGTFSMIDQGGRVYLDNVTGLYGGDIPINTATVTFDFNYTNYDGVNKAKGITNGFELSATSGVTWVATHDWGAGFPKGNWDLILSEAEFSWDGALADTVGFGASIIVGAGLPPSYDGDGVYLTVNIDDNMAFDGETFCIDSAYYPPSGSWMWAYGSTVGSFPPHWDGPHCWQLTVAGGPCPVFVNPMTDYTGDHCDPVAIHYSAVGAEGDPLTFSVVGGVGNIGAATGLYTYQPTLADVGVPVTADLLVDDGHHGDPSSCPPITLTMNFTNQPPVFTAGCGETGVAPTGNTGCITMAWDDVDCDPSTLSIISVAPTPIGVIYLDGDKVCFDAAVGAYPEGDGGALYAVAVELTDGGPDKAGSICEVYFDTFGEAFEVQIKKTHNTLQGMHTIVDVTQTKGAEDIGGWDFLIAYDASALHFQAAIPGDFHDVCQWEYFNYRYGPFGNCGSQCPSGMVRVVAIAETNNGPNHPLCLALPQPVTLFSLDFLVSNDRTLECQYVPIRFYWMDCGDNSIAYHPVDDPLASIQGVSRYVIDYDLIGHIEDMFTGFPTYTGVQWECLDNDPDKPVPIQYVDFLNGGVDIICADSIDDRGDINLNGTPNEIADAVLFSNYFVKGIGVFNVPGPNAPHGQIAATDVNADGLTLSVADLVYLIRIVVGDALPYPKLTPVPVPHTFVDGVLSVDGRMGAALAVFQGEVTPLLLADQMEMQYHFDGLQTRVLVSKIEAGASFEGAFLHTDGDLVSLEMATYDGAPVVSKPLPDEYRLFQNYPNPFNPKTIIAFALPHGGDYRLTVYNVTGREVTSFTGTAEAGQIETVEFDATGMGSGVYFYQLDAGRFSQSRKMVLLK